MPITWTVECYIDKNGREPVLEYICEGNNEQRIATLIKVIQMLMVYGKKNP